MGKKYTVLMTLMGLEIGGAETHVVELSKELSKKGYRVIVASNGGVYEKELAEAGIINYHVPMHKRNLIKMLKSYFLLKDIIMREKVDIVHSHARIPGFICGFLYRKMKFTFVTTAHWVFYTGMGLKYLTNWGQRVIAVSEDIKNYLIENYGINEKNISVTINGIDTDKFSPETPSDRIKLEFGLSDKRVLVHVSRLDDDRALAARHILSSAAALKKEIPELKILIIGNGDKFGELKGEAMKINRAVGEEFIIMPGARVDISEIISAAEVFVGVSRAALEAMASAKPVILAGNEGYIGIFDENKLSSAMENNFCCRGCGITKESKLKDDILYAFNTLTEEERKKYGDYGRRMIFNYYSVNRMAMDCISVYDAAYKLNQKPPIRVLMSGYYGFNNSGDEAILYSMYNNIRGLGDNIKITVLSNRPEETRAKYDVNVVYRFSLLGVLGAVRHTDVLLSGGGSLLQDTTSTRSIMYYLSIILLAKLFNKKVMLYANGIGPVSRKSNIKMVKRVVNKADIITLREDDSYRELRRMGVNNSKVYVTADPVFTMDSITHEEAEAILIKEGVPLDKPIVGVSIREWKGIESFTDGLSKVCERLVNEYERTVVFIVMQTPNDVKISSKMQEKVKAPTYIIEGNYSPKEMIGVIGHMELVLSMRLHTLIFAAHKRVPLLGFIYDPKIEYYLDKFKMPSGGRLSEFNEESIMIKIKEIIDNRDKYVGILDNAATELEGLAKMNEKYLEELF